MGATRAEDGGEEYADSEGETGKIIMKPAVSINFTFQGRMALSHLESEIWNLKFESLSPRVGHEKDEDRVKLQASGEHEEREDPFACGRYPRIVLDRPHLTEAGTDVRQTGYGGRKGRDQIRVFRDGHDNGAEHEEKYIDDEIGGRPDDIGIRNRLGIYLERHDRIGEDNQHDTFKSGFKGNINPDHLHPAAGGPRTASDEHEDHKREFQECGPEVEVGRCVSRRRQDGYDLESRLA